MKFVYPIKGKKAEDLYRLNREGHGGFYPLGTNYAYHGGMHFEGEFPVVAISDGSIIAYRYKTEYISETVEGESEPFNYSNCFVLILHKYTTPKKQDLIFYSLYNHLLPWGECTEEQRSKINAFGKHGYEIINAPNGLTVRSSKVTPSNDNKKGTLENGVKVVASKVDDTWAKIEEGDLMGNYFCHTYNGNQYGKSIIVSGVPDLDDIISCTIEVKAGDVLGYTGLYEGKGIERGHRTVHVEVFSDDSAEKFIKNQKGDGKPTHILLPEGVQLKIKANTYSDVAKIERFFRKAGTVVESVEPDNGGEWVQVQDKQVSGEFKRSSLIYDNAAKFYTVEPQFIEEIRKVFEKVEVTEETRFYWEAGGESDLLRTIRTGILDSGAKYWIARALLNDDATQLIADADGCYQDNPGAFTFEDGDKVTEEKTVEMGAVGKLHYEGELWYGIKADGGINGWVSENDVKVITPYDWPGFKILKEEEANPFLLGKMAISKDLWADYGDFPLFFQKIIDDIDTNDDRKICLREIQAALKNEETARKLSRVISVHPSEWSKEHWDDHWADLRGGRADNLKQRVEELCWWQSVKDKLQDNGGFLASPIVYHWNPVAFVEQMKQFLKPIYDIKQPVPERKIEFIAIHCSATRPSQEHIDAATIREWHMSKKPTPWSDIGYHFVIKRDGTIEQGRPLEKAGAHVYQYNAYSIGVCMVGGIDEKEKADNNFTDAQWPALESLIRALHERHPKAIIKGHRDFPDVKKDCPSFDVIPWWEGVK